MKSVVEIYPLDKPENVVKTYNDCTVECGLKTFFRMIWDAKTESRPAVFSRKLLTIVSEDGIYGARYKSIEKQVKAREEQEPAFAW